MLWRVLISDAGANKTDSDISVWGKIQTLENNEQGKESMNVIVNKIF